MNKTQAINFAISYTYQANEKRPYNLLLKTLYVFSKDEIKKIMALYQSAITFYNLIHDNKKIIFPDFPEIINIKNVCRWFLKIHQCEDFAKNIGTSFSDEINIFIDFDIQREFPYFRNLISDMEEPEKLWFHDKE